MIDKKRLISRLPGWLIALRPTPSVPGWIRRRRLAFGYSLLIAATALAFTLTEAYPNVHFFSRYGPNLATDLLGILVGVVFVDRLLVWRRERDLGPVRAIALRRLEPHLRYLFVWFHNAFLGAMAPNTPAPTSTDDLLDRWPDVVEWLDFCAASPANPQHRWGAFLAAGVQHWTNGINAVLEGHQETLGVELSAALEEVLDAKVLGLVRSADWLSPANPLCASGECPGFQVWIGPDRDPRREFAERARTLLAAYEKTGKWDVELPAEYFERTHNSPWAGLARSAQAPSP
jgi:hypothetical protein